MFFSGHHAENSTERAGASSLAVDMRIGNLESMSSALILRPILTPTHFRSGVAIQFLVRGASTRGLRGESGGRWITVSAARLGLCRRKPSVTIQALRDPREWLRISGRPPFGSEPPLVVNAGGTQHADLKSLLTASNESRQKITSPSLALTWKKLREQASACSALRRGAFRTIQQVADAG